MANPSPLGEEIRLQQDAARREQEAGHAALRRFLRPGTVVFDVGAHIGGWALAATTGVSAVHLHLFEPAPPTFATLCRNARRHFPTARCNQLAVADGESRLRFHYYPAQPARSGFFRHHDAEANGHLGQPELITVACVSLDAYCRGQGLAHIDVLNLDVEGAEASVLAGAAELLTAGAVDVIQFAYDRNLPDAGQTLRTLAESLRFRGYVLYAVEKDGPVPLPVRPDAPETISPARYLALHERLTGWFENRPPARLDLPDLLARQGIQPRGVIHIGAHEGCELAMYRAMGASPILFIEANPVLAERLRNRTAGQPDVRVAAVAITDGSAATATLHVTNMDQSSSVLALKDHRALYPEIVETAAIPVPAASLDGLLASLDLDPAAYNILNLDIQGAELAALRGATATLPHIEALNTEINFRELYAGGALSHELDAFLAPFGFIREAAICPYDPSWGDAFYARRAVLSLSSLGHNGRFANQLFQYAFLRHYAAKHALTAETPPWVGTFLFGANDPPPRRAYRRVRQTSLNPAADAVAGAEPPLRNVDIWGYFQYPSRYYGSPEDKAFFRRLFAPVPIVAAPLTAALSRLMAGRRTLVAMHLRRGDYGCGHFFVAPTRWYLDWLKTIWPTLAAPQLYLASDEPEKVLKDFAAYHPASRADLGDLGPLDTICPGYPDFFVLTRADRLAISNSSFSFAAAMLNETATHFVRPRLGEKRLIPFAPFDAPILFHDESNGDGNPS